MPVLNFIADGYKQLFADRLNETFKTGEIQRFEALGLGASNEGLWYDINVGPVNGQLYYNNDGDQSGPVPALYPKGFSGYYAMSFPT